MQTVLAISILIATGFFTAVAVLVPVPKAESKTDNEVQYITIKSYQRKVAN